MLTGNLLTQEQIEAGAGTLDDDNKLTSSQVDDLVSIFRWYLGTLASNYSVRSTFEALTDSGTTNKAAKLAAVLILFQDYQFDTGGFAATNANREGFNFSIEQAKFNLFKYAFTLFWDFPAGLGSFLNNSSQFASTQGFFKRV